MGLRPVSTNHQPKHFNHVTLGTLLAGCPHISFRGRNTFSGGTPESVSISGPRGIHHTIFAADDKGRTSVFYVDISWTSTQVNEGVIPVCFNVRDGAGYVSARQKSLFQSYTNGVL